MRISGYTVDKKPVFAGVYKYCGTYGVPLSILIDELARRFNGVIDWQDYVLAMKSEGADLRTIRARICEAIDIQSKERQEFIERLDTLLSKISRNEITGDDAAIN